jgi:glycosyltransferase involved in cell wall biosynthesis
VNAPSIVSVILPTVALASRAACLGRALESVLAQEGVRVDPIVVANGPDCDHDLLSALVRRRDIRLLRRRESGLGAAITAGRGLVDAPYFAELDDDDLLLPGALAARVARMETDRRVDAVVTSGYLRSARGDVLSVSDIAQCADDPLRAVIDRMWLKPGAGLFRTATISAAYFEGMPPYLEWTYLAVRLALERRIAFLDTPTFVYSEDTPRSLSKSPEYVRRQPEALRAVLRLPLPSDVRRALRRKYVAALHGASVNDLGQGRRTEAWKWHLRTLLHLYGWRYLTYTRHLFV